MTFNFCPQEKEVTELLQKGHWPLACSPELRSHVSACSRCRDLVLVTEVFQGDRIATERVARLNSPGVVWWRAQLRVRNAALEKVARPIQRAQVFALVVNLVVVAAFVMWEGSQGINWLSWFSRPAIQPVIDMQTLWSGVSVVPDWNLMMWLPSFGALALLSGMVVYLTREKK
jgi:hypothetical protein